MDAELAAWLCESTGAVGVLRSARIQSLWSGYGELLRVQLELASRPPSTVMVKWVRPARAAGERGTSDATSHARKCRSYDVETAFYRGRARECSEACRVAELHGSRMREGEWVLVLEDLDAAGFASRDRAPRGAALHACLDWLAAFHARFMGVSPAELWEVGTYWHLDTRRDELANIRDETVRAAAPALDRRLREARFQTLVHGDAKPDNFCFAADRRRVAAVDFQYVGGGAGVKDVAYLLHGARAHEGALEHYFARLREHLAGTAHDASAIEAEWRSLYATATQDFERFLAGWRR